MAGVVTAASWAADSLSGAQRGVRGEDRTGLERSAAGKRLRHPAELNANIVELVAEFGAGYGADADHGGGDVARGVRDRRGDVAGRAVSGADLGEAAGDRDGAPSGVVVMSR
jgi:hypothetical protein